MANERVKRSIEFQFGVDLGPAENSVAGLERQLEQLQEKFKSAEIGSAEFNRLGKEIQTTSSKLKTFDERFEGLGIEQKNAMIVDSFNVVVGAVGAVTGALVAFGVESKAIEGVEKRLLGIITVVSSLREVSNGLAAFSKVWPILTANISAAAAALRAFALANPFTAILVGITAVTAAVFALIKAQEEEKKSIEDLTEEYDKLYEINQRRDTNREREAELEIERVKLTEDEITAAEKTLQLSKDKLAQDETDLLVFRIKQDEVESALSRLDDEIIAKEKLVKLALSEEFAQTRLAEKQEQYREELNELYIKREEFLQREVNINQSIAKSQNDVLAAEQALDAARKKRQEDAAKRAKEARDKADKAAEELAKRAVKQLNDQKQATEDLIELYTELYPDPVSSDQFEFNTELDRTNFLLQQQLNIIMSLNDGYEDLGDQLEEVTDGIGESFFSEKQLEVFKKLRDASKTQLQLQLDALDATYREDLALFSDNEEMKSKITAQYEEDRAQLRREFAIQNAQAILGITSNFLTTLADINQQSLELQLLQAAGNQAAIDRINADALEKQKKLRIAQVLVTTAESILNGFNATSTLPAPFNLIAGGALALVYGALGAKTIQTINATTLEGGGSSGGGFNNVSGGGFSLPTGGGVSIPTSQGAILPGLGGGRTGRAPSIGTTVEQQPIRAYVLAGDVSNGVQANVALNNRRRLAG